MPALLKRVFPREGSPAPAPPAQAEYRFTLTVAGVDLTDDDVFGALVSGGCGDALIGVCDGEPVIDFVRYGPSLQAAAGRAARQVRAAVPGAEVVSVKVSPTTVGTPGLVATALAMASHQSRPRAVARTSRRETVATATAMTAFWQARRVATRAQDALPASLARLLH